MSEGFGVIPNWLVRDTSISGAAKMVYVVLSSHAGAQGTTWLSHATIAAESGTSVSSVQRALSALVGLGLVKVSPRRRDDGGQTSNLYRIEAHVPPGQNDQPPRSERPTPSVRVTDEEEPMKKNPTTTTSPSTDVEAPSGDYWTLFEQFWMTYPRKVGKRAAQAAYVRARRRGVMHTDILDGAQRYRDDPNREMKFTAHPTTWLNRDGWHDEPLPARNGRMSANEAVAGTMALAERLRTTPGFSTAAGPWGQIEGAGS